MASEVNNQSQEIAVFQSPLSVPLYSLVPGTKGRGKKSAWCLLFAHVSSFILCNPCRWSCILLSWNWRAYFNLRGVITSRRQSITESVKIYQTYIDAWSEHWNGFLVPTKEFPLLVVVHQHSAELRSSAFEHWTSLYDPWQLHLGLHVEMLYRTIKSLNIQHILEGVEEDVVWVFAAA